MVEAAAQVARCNQDSEARLTVRVQEYSMPGNANMHNEFAAKQTQEHLQNDTQYQSNGRAGTGIIVCAPNLKSAASSLLKSYSGGHLRPHLPDETVLENAVSVQANARSALGRS